MSGRFGLLDIMSTSGYGNVHMKTGGATDDDRRMFEK